MELYEKKEQFCRLFDSVTMQEGGIVYGELIRQVRKEMDKIDLYVHLLQYTQKRNNYTYEILYHNKELFENAYMFARWYETLSHEAKQKFKDKTLRMHFDRMKNNV